MRFVVVGALSLALAACNGGSSPDPSPSPTPTPTGTPTPAPTPVTVTFTTSEAGLQYTTEGGVQRVANVTAIAATMGTAFSFTPDTNGYTYTLLNGSVNPSASEAAPFPVSSIKTCDLTRLCFGDAFVFNQVAAGSGTYYLSRFIPGSSAVQLLNYVSFGAFEESVVDTPGGRLLVDLRTFAYGVPTPAASLPTTGTVTFAGPLVGRATGNKPGASGTSNVYRLSGSYQMVPNYAASTATLKLTITGTAVGCSPCAPNISLTQDVSGTIAAGVASFTLPGGNARFFIASPTAVEAGGSFVFTATDPNEAGVTMVVAGSAAGARQ